MADAELRQVSTRLVIRISSAAEAESTVAVAADLAGALGSELAGLFVEEEGAFSASALPFQAMLSHTGQPLEATPAGVAAAMAREADACRRLFVRAAERAQLAWSFRAERGEWLRLLGTSLRPEDILVLRRDALGGSPAGFAEAALGLAPARGGVLLLPRRLHVGRREIVVLAGEHGQPARLGEVAGRLSERLRIAAVEVDLSARPEPNVLRARVDQAWLAVASLDRLADRRNPESALLFERFRTPLLLLRTSDAD